MLTSIYVYVSLFADTKGMYCTAVISNFLSMLLWLLKYIELTLNKTELFLFVVFIHVILFIDI